MKNYLILLSHFTCILKLQQGVQKIFLVRPFFSGHIFIYKIIHKFMSINMLI